MKPSIVSRRGILLLGVGMAASACSQYLPQGSTGPGNLSRATILAKINDTRAANGRAPLKYSSRLARAAQTQARLMASRGELSHSVGGSLRARVNAVGYVGAVGENLAGGQKTLEAAIAGWLKSTTHRNTLLSPRFSEFGLSVASGGGTHKIYWAMILGGDFAAWQV